MKKALIQPGGRIAQIVNPGDEFEVHEALRWVDVPNTTTGRDRYVAGAVVKEVPPAAPTSAEIYDRALAGNPVLAALIEAVNAGEIGGGGPAKSAGAVKAIIGGRMS